MNREIKFRMWDLKEKKMYQDQCYWQRSMSIDLTGHPIWCEDEALAHQYANRFKKYGYKIRTQEYVMDELFSLVCQLAEFNQLNNPKL